MYFLGKMTTASIIRPVPVSKRYRNWPPVCSGWNKALLFLMVESSSNTHNLPVAMLIFCLNELWLHLYIFSSFYFSNSTGSSDHHRSSCNHTDWSSTTTTTSASNSYCCSGINKKLFYHFLFDKEKYSVSYIYWQNSKSPVSLHLQHQTLVYCLFINTV